MMSAITDNDDDLRFFSRFFFEDEAMLDMSVPNILLYIGDLSSFCSVDDFDG